MTEKTLDERVADALGLRVTDGMIVYGDQRHDCSRVTGFFTKSIANCKKHIEPVLIESGGDNIGFSIGFRYGFWTMCGIDAITSEFYFFGKGATEAEAYCDAFLGLKMKMAVPYISGGL